MPSLAELQAHIAHTVTRGEVGAAEGLVGGAQPIQRLLIHRRHYLASLTAALHDKFPATAWLVGREFLDAAARAYVGVRPPIRPCIAEYGSDFPSFVADFGTATTVPYLESFAQLEWAVGQVSIEVDGPPLIRLAVAGSSPDSLLGARFRLQAGLRYLRSPWNVDALMRIYLTGVEPEAFGLIEAPAHIEVRGTRGTLSIERLDEATFEFRKQLANGATVAEAAAGALASDASFDTGAALATLVHLGLAVGITEPAEEQTE